MSLIRERRSPELEVIESVRWQNRLVESIGLPRHMPMLRKWAVEEIDDPRRQLRELSSESTQAVMGSDYSDEALAWIASYLDPDSANIDDVAEYVADFDEFCGLALTLRESPRLHEVDSVVFVHEEYALVVDTSGYDYPRYKLLFTGEDVEGLVDYYRERTLDAE